MEKPEKREIVPYKDPDLVILRNPVAKAKFGLSVVQTKILFEVLAYFKTNPTEKIMRFYVRDYLNRLGLDSNNLKAYVDEVEAMTRLHLQIPEGENRKGINYLAVNLFAGARFRIDESGQGYVDIEVSEMLKPYFLEIAKGDFFYYHIVNTRVLKSTYSIKLYLLLKSYRRFNRLEISVAELRTILEIPAEQYTRYKDFKKRVLERAKSELSEKNDICFDYDELRVRPNSLRSEVTRIVFYIKDNPNQKEIKEKVKQLLGSKQERRAAKQAERDAALTLPFDEMPPLSYPTVPQMPTAAEPIQTFRAAELPEISPSESLSEAQTAVLSLFKSFDKDATDADVLTFIDGLQRPIDSVWDVLLYAQQEQNRGNVIKNIYAYLVSGLKSSMGKGLAAKAREKTEKQNEHKRQQAEHREVLALRKQFEGVEAQYFYDLGCDAEVEDKRAFLEKVRAEAQYAPNIRVRFFEDDWTLKQDNLRLSLGTELSRRKGETSHSLFAAWVLRQHSMRVEWQDPIWVIKEKLLF